jgi:hypothetical protein
MSSRNFFGKCYEKISLQGLANQRGIAASRIQGSSRVKIIKYQPHIDGLRTVAVFLAILHQRGDWAGITRVHGAANGHLK